MNLHKKIVAVILLFAFLPGAFSSCISEKKRYTKVFYGDFFDTVTELIVYADDTAEFNCVCDIVGDTLLKYHRLFDIYNDYDEMNNIKTINDNAGISAVEVSYELIEFLEYCIDMYHLTNGETNIAMGSVLSLWHECREAADAGNAFLPSEESLAWASEHCNIEKIQIDADNYTVFLDDPEMSIDVGAVAKGYAAEKIFELFKYSNIQMCISIGGNVKLIGNRPDGDWSVGIRDASDPLKTAERLSLTSGYTVVTSGDYERFFSINGMRYHHIIDRDTLYPASYFSSVSVISKSSLEADALSTALFCMSADEGQRLVDNLCDTYVLWILNDGTKLYSDGFEEILK